MFQKVSNQSAETRRPAIRWLAFAFLAICCLAADTAEAGLVSILSATDKVKIFDATAAVSGEVEGNELTGNTTLIGDNNYIAILFSDYLENSKLRTDWTMAYPDTASLSADVSGSSEVTFTVLEELKWSTDGGSTGVDSSANHDVAFKLVDNTTNTTLVDSSNGDLNGSGFTNFVGDSGSGTGGPFLVAGHTYTWESYFKTSQWMLGSDLAATAHAELSFTPTAVPEPTSLLMMGSAIGLFCSRRRR